LVFAVSGVRASGGLQLRAPLSGGNRLKSDAPNPTTNFGKPPRNNMARKKRLLMVVGAGASVNFGMPLVGQVGDIINAEAQKWYPLADDRQTNLYRHIERMVTEHWTGHVRGHLRRAPQFEDILYTIFALASAYPAGAYTSPFGALIRARKLPDIFDGLDRRTIDQHQLSGLGSRGVDALLDEFRERCRRSEQDNTAEFGRLQAFMTTLQTEFDIAVVTLNYDNVMYRALSGIVTGFDIEGCFQEKLIFDRASWSCMLHLHGSVHFDMRGTNSRNVHEIFWNPDIKAKFAQNAFGRGGEFNPEGVDFPTSAIIAGYGKTIQLSHRPFRTYYSELDRLVSGCDAVLFAGYGFGDPHVNNAFHRFCDDGRPVAIIEKRDDLRLADPMTDPVARAVVNIFETNLGPLAHSLPTKLRLLEAREFEIRDHLRVWYHGMLEIYDNPDKVIAQLGAARR
jgi:hypothetical protein